MNIKKCNASCNVVLSGFYTMKSPNPMTSDTQLIVNDILCRRKIHILLGIYVN